MQVCTSLQTDNHASTTPLSFYRPDALPATQPNQQRQSTEGTYITRTLELITYNCFVLFIYLEPVVVGDQKALAFTPEQYSIAEEIMDRVKCS